MAETISLLKKEKEIEEEKEEAEEEANGKFFQNNFQVPITFCKGRYLSFK